MAYIGNQPTTVAFLTDSFSGNGSTTAFTLSAAPANTNSILVAVSGVLQDPTTYAVSGTTLTFSAAPPSGTGNISVRFLGIPASGVVTTAYRTQTEFTATAGQTTFSVPSYTPGFIDVYRNGVLLGSTNFTATNGTTVVLANAASAGDFIEVVSFSVSSVLNAIPATAGAVTNSYLLDGSITKAKMGSGSTWAPAGTVVQVIQATSTTFTQTTSTSFVATSLTATITPTSNTSRIYAMVSGPAYSSGVNYAILTLYRNNTTNLGSGTFSALGLTGNNPGTYDTSVSFNYLDSPATTSATTYTVYLRSSTSTAATFDLATATGTIILMEIAA